MMRKCSSPVAGIFSHAHATPGGLSPKLPEGTPMTACHGMSRSESSSSSSILKDKDKDNDMKNEKELSVDSNDASTSSGGGNASSGASTMWSSMESTSAP